MPIKHSTNVVVADDGTSPVGSDEWNAAHTVDSITVNAASNSGAIALQVLPGSGTSFTKINDNGTMVIDADAGTGSNPLVVKYNGNQLFGVNFSGAFTVGTGLAAGGSETLNLGAGTVTLDSKSLRLAEVTAPTGTANEARIFAKDNGSGKTQLMVIFGTGAAVQIAIEP